MTLRTKATRPGQQWLALVAGILVLMAGAATAVLALVSDSGTFSVIVPNKETSSGLVPLGGDAGSASVEYIGSSANNQSSGTGIFDPFVRLQGSPTENGYNTNGTVQFDTKSGQWTKAILASAIPIVDCDGTGAGTALCWELFVDINENNTAKYVSLTRVEIWFADSPTLVGYNETTHTFASGAGSEPQYRFTGEIKIHDVNQGSGRGDLRYLVPVISFTAADWFVLYSEWGSSDAAPDGKTFASEGGFEEWKVRKAPNLSILKTANPAGPVNAGTAIGFDITVTNSGAAAATNVTITDPLPAGGGLNWSLDPAFTGCSIGGAVGSQTLTCTFATLASGASIGPIHITSPTTAADCGIVSNTATVASDAGPGGSSTASVTIQCGALQITKSAKHADTSGDTSANLVATFDITDSAGNLFQVTTDATGVGCVGGMAVGLTQSIVESSVPTGYAAPTIANVTVASGACGAVGVTNVNVENTPLTDVDITIDSQHNGATSTLIECWGPGSDPATDPADYSTTVSDGSLSIDDLDPTDPAITLNCQITVDP